MGTTIRNGEKQAGVALGPLYPSLTEAELKTAEMNLRRYFSLAIQIEQELRGRVGSFDSPSNPPNMEERSNSLKS